MDADARVELRTLPKDLAGRVARHLVMAGRLAEEDPEAAYKHAREARRLASRVGLVREAAGLAAYRAGEWAEALAELRAARRLSTGDDAYLPVMADCERGLGRPERALDLIKSPEAKKLDQAGRIELRIVESGARRDLGQADAAVVTLQVPELKDRRLRPWSARLFYAYADALADAGRMEDASDWFARAAAADRDDETDAAERYAEIEGLDIFDTEEAEELIGDAELPETEDVVILPEPETPDVEGSGDEEPSEAEGPSEGEEPSAEEPEAPTPDAVEIGVPEIADPTAIAFQPAEDAEVPGAGSEQSEDAPEPSVVFLEPKTTDDPGQEPRPPAE
ncbi:hypothetical protein F8566_46100 [Actinomadura rudentiformis]|uniref:Tetratricopeptide repeat protein n=1 Tax=Actinomadura rudentiformis TaxID=359158 RepID=A0A6H9YHI4_9ACTN|nr:hypothetical protein F8566_46100 [Actinomadura rudentiformis]